MRTNNFSLWIMLLFALNACSVNETTYIQDPNNQAIVNGQTADKDDKATSATVAIGYIEDNQLVPFCTGVVISSETILTAAHCIDDDLEYKTLNQVFVFHGTNLENSSSQNLIAVTAAIAHKDFHVEFNTSKKAVTTWNDIAVLKLAKELPKEAYVSHLSANAELTKYVDLDGSLEIKTIGWGLIQTKPDLTTLTLTSAVLNFSGYWQDHILYNNYESPTKYISFCSGDSGGPGFVFRNDNYIAIGVVRGPHFPHPNCMGYGEFTNIGRHIEFIKKAQKSLSSQDLKIDQ